MKLVLALVLVAFHCGSWRYAAAQGPGASPGPTTPVPADTARALPAAPAPPTPWDIFLACRAEPLPASVKGLCELRLPVIGRDFTRTELNDWAAVLANPTPVDQIEAARTQAERRLVETAKNVSRAIAGNHEFSFAEGADTLGLELQQHLRRHAAAAAAAFAADSQPIDVLGFADYARDTPDPINRALAERRAHHVAAFFRGAGIPSDSIRVKAVLVRNPSGSDAVGQPYRKVAIGGMSSTLSAPTPAGGDGISGLSPADLMAGASDFLIERAKEELQTYILRVGVDRICTGTGTTWTTMLPATCGLLPDAGDTLRYIPGPATLQEALRTDLRQMPYSIAEQTLGAVAVSAGEAARSRITTALVLVRYLRSVSEGAEPLAALGTWQAPRFTFGGHDLSVPATIQRVGTVADLARGARADLSAQVSGAVLGDSVALYVLRALVIRSSPEFPASVWSGWASGANVARVNSALHAVRTAQYVAKEVEAGWSALRNAANDSTAADARAVVVAEVVSAATSMFAVDLGSGTQGSALLGDPLLEPARDMVISLTRGNSRAALTSLVRLVQAGADKGSTGLSDDHTRLLGFVNDASQARTVDEFSGALESLVGVERVQ